MGKLMYTIAGMSNAGMVSLFKPEGAVLAIPTIEGHFKNVQKVKDYFDVTGAECFILDSGGFQLLISEEQAEKQAMDVQTGSIDKYLVLNPNAPVFSKDQSTVNITPYHVVLYARELQPQIVMALDSPVGKKSKTNTKTNTDTKWQEWEFLEKFGFNVAWAIQTARLREQHCPDSELFLPVQSYNLDQFEIFYECICRQKFDGLALPTRNMNAELIASFLLRFFEKGIRKVHILGTSSFTNIVIAAFVARHLYDWVSFDCQTPFIVAYMQQCYLNPWNLREEKVGANIFIDHWYENDCPCPWCKYVSFDDILNMPKTEMNYFLINHNYWVTNAFAKRAYESAVDLWNYRRFLLNATSDAKLVENLLRVLTELDVRSKHFRRN